jgi:hypothetical protein
MQSITFCALFGKSKLGVGRTFLEGFFCGEGPRSRRYGRTAALRLLVQPSDGDDDDYFLSFS